MIRRVILESGHDKPYLCGKEAPFEISWSVGSRLMAEWSKLLAETAGGATVARILASPSGRSLGGEADGRGAADALRAEAGNNPLLQARTKGRG
jgi:hypothetical protein